MEDVLTWLRTFGLETYSSTFELNGWNELVLLPVMGEKDINMCISKPGDTVRFRKALETLCPSAEDTNSQSEHRNNIFQRKMEEVYNWLTECHLGRYSPSFKENAWDNLSLLLNMTEMDMDICIARRGDIARFKNSLKRFKETAIAQHVTQSEDNSQYAVRHSSMARETTVSDHSLRSSNDTDQEASVDIAECRPGESEIQMSNKYEDDVIGIMPNFTSAVLPQRRGASSYTDCHIGYSAQTTVYKESPTYIIQDPKPVSSNSFEVIGRIFAKRYDSKKHLFVETQVFEEMKSILERTDDDKVYWVTLLGRPGDGKSTIIAHLMLMFMQNGYEPILLSSPNDWRTFVANHNMEDGEAKHFIIIDDMFGTSFLDKGKFHGWLSQIPTMQFIAEERKDKMLIVCASRRYIFADVESALARFNVFKKYLIVDMTEKGLQLSSENKVEMFNKYADHYKFPRNEEDIGKVDPPHGFPHCVELYSKNAVLRRNGIKSFFSNPSECVRNELRNFRFNDRFKFLVLLLLLLSNNRLEANFFESMINKPTEAERRILQFLGVSSTKDTPEIYKAINALKNTYLIQASDGSYCFTHESLKENVASEFISLHPSLAIDIVDFKYIVEYINIRDPKTDLESVLRPRTSIRIDCVKPLAERIVNEILTGNVSVVSVCDAWNDPSFIKEWIVHITNDMVVNLEQLLTSSKGRYPNCPSFRPVEELRSPKYNCDLDDTVLEFLTKIGKYDAVVAMLECKQIKTIMKQYVVWKKILQHALDHIDCTIKADIPVTKSFLDNLLETGLAVDGTVALKNALTTSDLGCAYLLLQETQIRPNFVDKTGGGVFHYLVQSDLKLNDYDEMSKMLINLKADINLRNNTGDTPLLLCMRYANDGIKFMERLECLARNGAMVCERNSLTGLGCLHHVISYFSKSNLDLFHSLIASLLKHKLDINIKDFKGRSPLYMYIEKILTTNGLPDDYENKIRYLVSMGADVNTNIAENGMGILHMLANSDISFEKFKYIQMCLLQCGADINMEDAEGNSPLNYCIYIKERPDECFDRCAYLIQNGAKIQEQDYEAGNFLLAALQIYKMETCTEMLPQISDYLEDYTVVDEHGQNAMHYVFQKQPEAGYLKLFHYLTAAGVTFNRTDKMGRLPVMFTLQNCFELSILRYLIQESPANQTDIEGKGYFHYLCKSKANFDHFRRCCKLLIDNGENMNIQDSNGISPAFETIANENFSWKYTEFLHSCGANLRTKDYGGRNAAVFALMQKREKKDICQLLRYLFTVDDCLTWK